MTTKFDAERAAEARSWIESVTGEKFASDDFQQALKSGVLLCKLLNKLQPGTVAKINESKLSFPQMENIAAYIDGARKLGVPDEYNFMTVDLYEGKNLGQVVQNILSLKRLKGGGFTKQTKDQNSPTIPMARDQTTTDKITLPTEQTIVTSENDVKRTGNAYVSGRQDNTQAFTCPVCTKYVTSAVVNALGKQWHTNCFCCKKCGVKLAISKYYEHNDQPYCERCILIVKPQTNVKAATKDMGFQWNKQQQ